MARPALALGLLAALAAGLAAWPAAARPAADAPMHAPILQQQGLPYRFSDLRLASADGQRHYHLWIARPHSAAPAAGYPVAWLLDGNAALGALNKALLERLAAGEAPVLVAVGYDTPLRIDAASRSVDYTLPDPANAAQANGGAERFLDLLEQRMRPAVAAQLPLDGQRQALWGHSYGGLLVLHTLLTRPRAFSAYAAASPSLWWANGALLKELPGLPQRLGAHTAQLLLMRGDGEPAQARPDSTVDMLQATQHLRAQLQQVPGVQVGFRTFPGLNHGQMLDASLRHALDALYAAPSPAR